MRLAIIDGTVRPAHEATISVFDRGLLYGDSVLETLRTYGGRAFELGAHLSRLAQSLEAIAIALPDSREAFETDINTALRVAQNDESVLRVIVTRGEGPGGLDPSQAGCPVRIVTIDALDPPSPRQLRHGIRTRTFRTIRASDAVQSAKLTSYLASVLATRDARAAGADEALILDSDGRVLEGTTFNVFAVIGTRLLTPPTGFGVLDGITRRIVLELAQLEGMTIELRAMTPDELGRSDEVFVTSTLRELVGVATVDEHRIAKTPGPWTQRLHNAFRRRAGAPPPRYDDT